MHTYTSLTQDRTRQHSIVDGVGSQEALALPGELERDGDIFFSAVATG